MSSEPPASPSPPRPPDAGRERVDGSGVTPRAATVVSAAAGGVDPRRAMRSAGIISLAIACSRVLGLIREMILAALFAGENRKWLDCFNMAFRTPNMLRDLFAEGALSTAFVTVFSKKIANEGDRPAWQLACKMATLTAVFMSGVAIAGIVFAPFIIDWLAFGWRESAPEKIEFTVLLARIMFPFIALVSLAALVMGMLNAKDVFGIPAMASSFFNLGSIIGGGLLGWWIDPTFGKNALIGFAFGTLIGGLCQLTIQFPALRKVGFRYRRDLRWRDSGVTKILQLMWPAVIAGSAVQVNVLLNSIFASFLVDGSVSWLSMAFRLMQLPLGIFGVAVATVTLPALARAAREGWSPDFNRQLATGMRTVFALTLPAALGLSLLAEPIISVIFERGRFDLTDRLMTAEALRFYAVGLLFYGGIKVVQPAFTAIDRRFVPMYVSLASILVNAGLNSWFVFGLGKNHAWLALSTGVVAAVNFFALVIILRHLVGTLHEWEFIRAAVRSMAAAAVMVVTCVIAQHTLLAGWDDYGQLIRILTLGAVIGVAGTLYLGLCHLWKVEEVSNYLGGVYRRFHRRRSTPPATKSRGPKDPDWPDQI